MWTPPFPPERFEDYDDEAGMESQVKVGVANHSSRRFPFLFSTFPRQMLLSTFNIFVRVLLL